MAATQWDELFEIHKRVKFTDVSLGLTDVDVCRTCHAVLDEPDDWDESTEGEWRYPAVQDPYPCRTRQLLEAIQSAPTCSS